MSWKPLCTTCAYPAPHVYTTYSSASNIRLAVCSQCNSFVDPLIESPPLFLALDLLLLKPRVFLHLLFNRGSPPRTASDSGNGTRNTEGVPQTGGLTDTAVGKMGRTDRQRRVKSTLITLILATVAAEVAVRVFSPPTSYAFTFVGSLTHVAQIGARVAAELLAQLGASMALAVGILTMRRWYGPNAIPQPSDGRQAAFLPLLVPLVLLYTALIPLLLQLALGVWYVPSGTSHRDYVSSPMTFLPQPLADVLREFYNSAAVAWDSDPIWTGTRLLGGMSAGFGLRVLLPTRPWETTAIVLEGWGAAALVGRAFDLLG